jgi:serine/threonine protein kinase/regulator of sirC expression with transglutaminase-like and TPR domain
MATTLPATGRFFGRFEILRELGAGGMGAVYHVHDPQTDRELALKVLGLPLAAFAEEQRRELLRRFEREAQVASSLVHPGIARVLEAGETAGAPWIAMELVKGETLAHVLAREGPRFRARGAALVGEVARAIDAAHRAGFVHRDLKPANVMVEEGSGRARVLDFGLAREISPGSRLTKDGQALGTPEYMAPEQAKGELDAIDVRTDVYGLGAILYEVLTGSPPFTGSAPWKVAMAVIQEDVRRPREKDPTISEALERVCLRALSRDKESRHATAAAFAEDLRAALATSSLVPRRSLVPAALVVCGLASLVPLGVAASRRTAQDPLPAPVVSAVPAEPDLTPPSSATIPSVDILAPRPELPDRLRPRPPSGRAGEPVTTASPAAVSSVSRALAERFSESSYRKFQQHDLDGALADADRAIERDATLSIAWTNRGIAREAKGDLDGAEADFTHSIGLNPDRPIPWNNRASIRQKRGDFRGALDDLEHAMALDPSRSKVWNNRGFLRWKLGDHEGAVADLVSAVTANPSDGKAWNTLGMVRSEIKQYGPAIEAYLKAAELAPRDPRPWANMGNTKLEMEDWKGAIDDCTKAISLDARHSSAFWGRAVARAATGDKAGAIEDFERYLQLAPNGKGTQQARMRLAELKKQP